MCIYMSNIFIYTYIWWLQSVKMIQWKNGNLLNKNRIILISIFKKDFNFYLILHIKNNFKWIIGAVHEFKRNLKKFKKKENLNHNDVELGKDFLNRE